jgi:hypothetical protein
MTYAYSRMHKNDKREDFATNVEGLTISTYIN